GRLPTTATPVGASSNTTANGGIGIRATTGSTIVMAIGLATNKRTTAIRAITAPSIVTLAGPLTTHATTTTAVTTIVVMANATMAMAIVMAPATVAGTTTTATAGGMATVRGTVVGMAEANIIATRVTGRELTSVAPSA